MKVFPIDQGIIARRGEIVGALRALLPAVLRWCRDNAVKVVPRGAGTFLSGGALPLADAVLLGIARFNRIIEIDHDDRLVVAQPGCTNLSISQVEAIAGRHGVGVEKRDLMPEMFSEVDLAHQPRVKCAFDPQMLLNPGKVFPALHRCAELGRLHVHRGRLPHPELPRF